MSPPRRAKDIMRREVITLPESTDIWELARLLTSRGITGAPVVDAQGELIGVVSQTDIVRHLQDLAHWPLAEYDFYAESENDPSPPACRALTAKDLMNPTVIQADEETAASELALIMTRRHVHRIIITRDKKIVGIVTTMDLIKAL